MGLVVLALALGATGAWAAEPAPLSDPAAINKALESAKAGDTIVIRDGLYVDARIVLSASGEKDKPITLAAETPGKVFFTGKSQIRLAGKHQHVTGFAFQKAIGGTAVEFKDAQHCRLSHTAFNESGNPQSTFTHMIEVGENCSDIRIDHCYMGKSLSMSIGTRIGAVRGRIDHNWFRDIVARSRNGQEAIQLQGYRLTPGTGAPIKEGDHRLFCTVECNLFDGACGDEEIISVKSDDNTIRYNTFLGHPTANKGGLCVRGGDRNVIDSNYFLNTVYGIRVSGAGNKLVNNYIQPVKTGLLFTGGGNMYAAAKDTLVANNTIVCRKPPAVSFAAMWGMTHPSAPPAPSVYPTGCKFHNNIFVCGYPQILTDSADRNFEGVDFQNNLIACNNPKKADASAMPKAPGLIHADGGLLVLRDDRYRPAIEKLVVDQGVPMEGITTDIDGRARKNAPDIGCEELNAGNGVRQPLTGKDVGPDWMKGNADALEQEAGIQDLRELIRKHPDPEYRRRLREILDGAGQ